MTPDGWAGVALFAAGIAVAARGLWPRRSRKNPDAVLWSCSSGQSGFAMLLGRDAFRVAVEAHGAKCGCAAPYVEIKKGWFER